MATTVLEKPTQRESLATSGMAFVWAIAVAKLLFHIYFNNRYGYFRDEFDYIACARHLAWGYVDQPPLVPFLARISGEVLGYSLRAIRLVPALASSILVIQTAAITRELGGKRFAVFAERGLYRDCPAISFRRQLARTNCLEPNLWMACAYLSFSL